MEVQSVSTMLNWAVENQIIGSNPIERLKGLRNDKKRKVRRSLALGEVHKIIDASPDQLRPVWRMFSWSGLRHGGTSGLEVSGCGLSPAGCYGPKLDGEEP